MSDHDMATPVAIIGMAGRFPGTPTVDALWDNIRNGTEAITFFTDDELLAAGVDPAMLDLPNYVKASGALDDVDHFDAEFFGFTAREAESMDPQQRLFLEVCWHALEHAGYGGPDRGGRVGVFAGGGPVSYLWTNVLPALEPLGLFDDVQGRLRNDKDFLTTWVSYKLGLEGPSVAVQTACSTSLVAVHLACESLSTGSCDMALAGGVSIALPHGVGYLHQRGGVTSPDGHCRPFDQAAQGFVMGSGAAAVVLKRLDDAVRDGDEITAVVKGSAINNDGSVKAGFTAPSVDGQARAVATAWRRAGLEPSAAGYIEAHGTGTAIGDPIEVEALHSVFGKATTGRCAIGSSKANIGHLDAAAGVTGLISAALAVCHGEIPPLANFTAPNPLIDFGATPFYISTQRRAWPDDGMPRTAGVTSLGMGGTNAHVVVQQSPDATRASQPRRGRLFPMGARSPAALDALTAAVADGLDGLDDRTADAARTLQTGRTHFDHRRYVVASSAGEAAALLRDPGHVRTRTAVAEEPPSVAFVFPGQGAQYADMGADLYKGSPTFRDALDECAALFRGPLGYDIRGFLYPGLHPSAALPPYTINDTAVTQPAVFVVSYALAQQWQAWGIQPVAMAGHSIGEFVAACIAGVFSLDDVTGLVAARGRLMQSCEPGSMAAVRATAQEAEDLIAWLDCGDDLALAAVNAPRGCVVAGPDAAIERFTEAAEAKGMSTRRLETSHAFHSAAMAPIVPAFIEQVAAVTRQAPALPVLSNVSGTWLTADEAVDPSYWGRHLRSTVRFADNVAELLDDPSVAVVEAGPPALEGVIRQHPACGSSRAVVASLPRQDERADASARLLDSLGQLWLHGVPVLWDRLTEDSSGRLPMALYPFQRERYWLEPTRRAPVPVVPAAPMPTTAIAPVADEAADDKPAAESASADDHGTVMLGIFRDVFGNAEIALEDNFFDLGGDSLAAIQLINRIADVMGAECSIETLFDAETIADLAEAVAGAGS